MSDDLASVGRSHLDGQPAIRLLDLLGRTLTVQPQDIVVRHIYRVLVRADTASRGPRGGGRGRAGRWAGRGGLGLRVGEHVFAPGRELGAHRCTSSLEASDTQSADERGWDHVFLGGLASGHVNSCSGCRGGRRAHCGQSAGMYVPLGLDSTMVDMLTPYRACRSPST